MTELYRLGATQEAIRLHDTYPWRIELLREETSIGNFFDRTSQLSREVYFAPSTPELSNFRAEIETGFDLQTVEKVVNIQDFGNGEYEIFNPLYSTSVVYVINLIPNNIPSALMFLNQVTASYKVHAHVVPSNKNEVYCTYVPYSSAPSLPSASGVIWFKRVS